MHIHLLKKLNLVFIAGILTVALCGCGEQEKKAEERGKVVGKTLGDAKDKVKAIETQAQENASKAEKVIQEPGEK
jgi:uncharacterized lipoprotein YehR (DUF1307 family)